MEIKRKTVESKYAPKQTNVVWVDTSGDTPVEKHFIKGKWIAVGSGGSGGAGLSYPNFSESETYYVGDKVTYNNNLYEFTETHEAGVWDESQVKEVSSTDILDASKMVEIHWKDLVDLRDNEKLVPGTWYRIIDYSTVINDSEARSLKYRFDILVLATDTNELSEDAYAINHKFTNQECLYNVTFSNNITKECYISEQWYDPDESSNIRNIIDKETGLGTFVPLDINGNSLVIDEENRTAITSVPYDNESLKERLKLSYFDSYGCNLSAWKLRYCLDNDKERFNWALYDLVSVKYKQTVYALNQFPLMITTKTTIYDNFDAAIGDLVEIIETNSGDFAGIYRKSFSDEHDIEYAPQSTTSTYVKRLYTIDGTYSKSITTYKYIYSDESKYNIVFGSSKWIYLGYIDKYYLYGLWNNGNAPTLLCVAESENITNNPDIKLNYDHGYGVIYKMIDEHNNECPYDFKNIQFKRYFVQLNIGDYVFYNVSRLVTEWLLDKSMIIDFDENNYNWYYTYNGGLEGIDVSVINIVYSENIPAYNNVIKPNYRQRILDGNSDDTYGMVLNNIVITCAYTMINTYIGNNCFDITLNSAYENYIECESNTILSSRGIYSIGNRNYYSGINKLFVHSGNNAFITNYGSISNCIVSCSSDLVVLPKCKVSHVIINSSYLSGSYILYTNGLIGNKTPINIDSIPNKSLITLEDNISTLKVSEFINYTVCTITTSGDIPDYITIDNAATSIVKGEPYIAKLTCTFPVSLGSHSVMMGDYNVTTSVWNSVNAQTAVIYIPTVTGNIVINANT